MQIQNNPSEFVKSKEQMGNVFNQISVQYEKL